MGEFQPENEGQVLTEYTLEVFLLHFVLYIYYLTYTWILDVACCWY